jgi:LysM repeat protein
MRKPITRFTLTLIASLCVFSSLFSQREKDRVSAYIQEYKELAISEMIRTGVPASITLAQGLLETGYGQSDLAINANNHFGIKCKSDWTGESVLHDDDKKGECFRKYPTVLDSYKDHSDFLKNRPNYAFLFQIDPVDYKGWARGLKKAGYATNPVYAEKLIKFIEDNSLQDYTLIALERQPGKNNETLATAKSEKQSLTPTPLSSTVSNSTAVAANPVFASNSLAKTSAYPKGAPFNINSAKVLYVEAGTSLFAVAAKNSISFTRLLDFNDLSKVDIIEKDQLIFLEKKQRKGSKDYHVVEPNEDLYDIAQAEGIQLNSMLEFNHLTKTSKPVVGQKIYLKGTAPVSTATAGNFKGNESSSMD